jgi:hypothetical protein
MTVCPIEISIASMFVLVSSSPISVVSFRQFPDPTDLHLFSQVSIGIGEVVRFNAVAFDGSTLVDIRPD